MNPLLVKKAIEVGIKVAPKVAKKLPSKVNFNPHSIKIAAQDLSKGLGPREREGFWDFRPMMGKGVAKGREYYVKVGNKLVKRIKK